MEENLIFNIIRCLYPEIEKIHYQSREENKLTLQSLLAEVKGKGNLVTELISALEKHLEK